MGTDEDIRSTSTTVPNDSPLPLEDAGIFFDCTETRMALFLLETPLPTGSTAQVDALVERFAQVAAASNGALIEVQVGTDAGLVYAIVEHDDAAALEAAVRAHDIATSGVVPVRLVGADLAALKLSSAGAQYLVEWDIPAGISMEQYLTRKREKAPLYANVPETRFLRTYVREDMAKCLCLYDAPDEDAVRRARDAVSTPVDRLTRLA